MRETVSIEELRSILHYDPLTGIFTWVVTRGVGPSEVRPGDQAGTLNPSGYIQIGISGSLYKAHRLAFAYVEGRWPSGDVDHEDTVKSHNWYKNLREATRAQNIRNAGMRRDNKSGFKGVSWHKQRRKWTARIHDGGKYRHLGLFEKVEDAARAFNEATMKIDPIFSRVQAV